MTGVNNKIGIISWDFAPEGGGMRPIADDFTFRSDAWTYRRGVARPVHGAGLATSFIRTFLLLRVYSQIPAAVYMFFPGTR